MRSKKGAAFSMKNSKHSETVTTKNIKYMTKFRNTHGTDWREGDGFKWVAPFIEMSNGDMYNIWDIPEKEYTVAVEEAIKRSFKLGMRYAKETILKDIDQSDWPVKIVELT